VNDVLGDEADLALCETCNVECYIDDTANVVVCEGCAGVYHRKYCWTDHWCGPLTDRNGRLVRMGHLMIYPDRPRITYRVTEMAESFRKHALCVGVAIKSKDHQRIPMHTRLMEIKNDD
jgi:hypothetical protein